MDLKFCLIILSVWLVTVFCQCPYNNDAGVTPEQASLIIKLHNHIRVKILRGEVPGQPKGYNMKIMKWDPTLAAKAQAVANTCRPFRKEVTDPRWGVVGQNVYRTFSSSCGSNWNDTINAWYEEHKNYEYGEIFPENCENYLQIVWANSQYIGCGYTTFKSNNRVTKFYVCNYGPAGNVRGENPYPTRRTGRSDIEDMLE